MLCHYHQLASRWTTQPFEFLWVSVSEHQLFVLIPASVEPRLQLMVTMVSHVVTVQVAIQDIIILTTCYVEHSPVRETWRPENRKVCVRTPERGQMA